MAVIVAIVAIVVMKDSYNMVMVQKKVAWCSWLSRLLYTQKIASSSLAATSILYFMYVKYNMQSIKFMR